MNQPSEWAADKIRRLEAAIDRACRPGQDPDKLLTLFHILWQLVDLAEQISPVTDAPA